MTVTIKRIITALILLTGVVAGVTLLNAGALSMILGLLAAAAGWEWCRLQKPRTSLTHDLLFVVLIAICVPVASRYHGVLAWILLISVVWWLWCLWHIILKSDLHSGKFWNPNALKGILTIVPASVAIAGMVDSSNSGRWSILACLLIIWVTDTGAYVVGSSFGKRLLAPTISPGKTLEGLVGGLIVAITCGILLYQIIDDLMAISFIGWVLLVTVTSIFASIGDLTESAFKRRAGVKDSGRILPGHGGMLDRIDSATAAIPVFVGSLVYVFR
jgi:phosphatidate cytidylyltransferase